MGRATFFIEVLSLFSLFQSTPSVGRATCEAAFDIVNLFIFQSTPSVGRATEQEVFSVSDRTKFQSTPSVGRATNGAPLFRGKNAISIHALRGEGDGVLRK